MTHQQRSFGQIHTPPKERTALRRVRQFVLLALLLTLALAFQLPVLRHNDVADYDEALHLDCARSILRTGLPIRRAGAGHIYFNHPPLYLYLLAGDQAALGENVLTGRLLSVACSLAALALVGSTTWTLSGAQRSSAPPAPLIAASLLGVQPLFVILATSVQFEMCLTMLLAGSLLAMLQAEQRGSNQLYLLAGVLLGLALLTKALAILLLGAFCLYHLLRYQRRALTTPPLYRVVGPALALFGLWFLFGALTDPTLFRASFGRWLGQAPVAHDPRVGLGWLPWLRQAASQGMGWPLTALLAPALLWAILRLRRAPQYGLMILYLILGIVASLVMSTKEVRHLLPLLVPAILLITGFLAWLLEPLWQRPAGRGLAGLALIALLVLVSPIEPGQIDLSAEPSAWLQAPYQARVWETPGNLMATRLAGEWLGLHTPTDALLVTAVSGPIVGYYADRAYDLLYVRDYTSIAELLAASEILVEDAPLDSAFALPELSPEERQRIIEMVHAEYVPVHGVQVGGREVRIHARIGSPLAQGVSSPSQP